MAKLPDARIPEAPRRRRRFGPLREAVYRRKKRLVRRSRRPIPGATIPEKSFRPGISHRQLGKKPQAAKKHPQKPPRGGGGGGGRRRRRGRGGRSIFSPYSYKELMRLARAQVDFEIGQATSPLERATERYAEERARAQGELSSLYGTVMPWVQGAAERTAQFSEQSRADEQAIYGAARERLGALGQTRAAEAQGLAQTLGAPIPVEGFSAPVEGATAQFEGTTAAEQLASIGGQQADVAATEAFAGRVFPLMRTEAAKDLSFRYDQAIEQVQEEIRDIKKQRGTMISKEFADRLLAERQFALSRIQANRDFQIARKTLGLQRGELTGRYKGRPTMASKQMRQQQRQFQANLQENQRQFNIQSAQQQQQINQAASEGRGTGARAEKRAQAFALAAALTAPGKPETYTYTALVPVAEGTTGAFQDPKSPTGWSKAQNITKALPQRAINSPLALFRTLLKNGVPRGIALNVTRTRMGNRRWKPSDPWGYKRQGKKVGRHRPKTVRGGD